MTVMPLVLFMCMHVILVFSITFIKGTQSQENFRRSNMRSRRSSGKSTAFRGCWISCWLETHVFYNSETSQSELLGWFRQKKTRQSKLLGWFRQKKTSQSELLGWFRQKRPDNRNFSVDFVQRDQPIGTSRLIPAKETSQSELFCWFRL